MPAAAAAALGFAALGVHYLLFVVPNDRRVDFPFPEEPAPRATVVYDFAARAAEAKFSFAEGPAALPAAPKPPAALHAVLRGRSRAVRRRSLDAPASSQYEFAPAVPPKATLDFHYGVQPGAAGLRFVVEALGAGGEAQVLFSGEASPASPPRGPPGRFRRWFVDPFRARAEWNGDPWRRAVVDMSAWAGQTPRLRFRVEPLPAEGRPAEDAVPARGFWGAPRLRAAAEKPPTGDNVVLLVLDALSAADLGAHGARGNPTPQLDRVFQEGIDLHRVYANTVADGRAIPPILAALHFDDMPESLLAPAPERAEDVFPPDEWASLAVALRAQGYRTAAFGSTGPGPDPGFDETQVFARDGYDVARVWRRAVEWISSDEATEPYFLLVDARTRPRPTAPAPVRFWVRTFRGLPLGRAGLRRWRARAQLAYADEYAGKFFDVMDAFRLWDRSLTALVSARGSDPRFAEGTAGRLSENELRVVWGMKHKSFPAGLTFPDPVELLDLPATVLKTVKKPVPARLADRGFTLARGGGLMRPVEMTRILAQSATRKAVIIDQHFKYVRPRPNVALGTGEEVYDIWTDPGETRNLIRRERSVLDVLRRSMEEVSPERKETRLVFWDLGGRKVRGVVESPGGELRNFQSSEPGAVSRGSYRTDFEITASSGVASFEIWPPGAPFVLRLRLDDAYFAADQIRASRFGLPLFERSGVEWFDHTTFPWIEGIAEPGPGEKGPLLFIGRLPAGQPPAEDER